MPTLTATKTRKKKRASRAKPQIRAAKGAMFSQRSAESFVAELQKLGRNEITAEELVEIAGSNSSAFHNFIFRQDDTQAAHAHRISLARHVLNHLEVVFTTKSGELQTKCFYSIGYIEMGKSMRVYKDIEVVIRSKSDKDEILHDLLCDVVQLIKTYTRYEAVFDFNLQPLRTLRSNISKRKH
ncbi:MAG: hypothetical protein V3S55_09735 [Nitrospiraceae bacterium]